MVPSTKVGLSPRYSITGIGHMVLSTLAVQRPSMSAMVRPASATAAWAARASNSISVKPGDSPQPNVATPAMAALPRKALRPALAWLTSRG